MIQKKSIIGLLFGILLILSSINLMPSVQADSITFRQNIRGLVDTDFNNLNLEQLSFLYNNLTAFTSTVGPTKASSISRNSGIALGSLHANIIQAVFSRLSQPG